MLIPKRVKHRKQFRGRMKGTAQRGNKVAHGDYGLVALEPANRSSPYCYDTLHQTWRQSLD